MDGPSQCQKTNGQMGMSKLLPTAVDKATLWLGHYFLPVEDFDDAETADLLSGKKVRVLVSTDVGSRGLDLDNVELVVMFDCPRNPTDFLHRAVRDRRPLCFCFTRLL